MNLASPEFGSDRPGVNYLLQTRAESNRWLLQNRAATPKQEQILDTIQHIFKTCGLLFTESELEGILALFPLVRIEIAVHGIERIDVQHNLMDAVSNFFLGCTWPRIGDNVNVAKFLALLQHQALAMGYALTRNMTDSTTTHCHPQ